MSIDHCMVRTSDLLVPVGEKGKKATFRNPHRSTMVKIKIDNCVVKNATAADYVVSKPACGDVVVELKGKDVESAIKQIEATIDLWRKRPEFQGKIAGLIVASQCPKVSTKLLKAKSRILRDFKAHLHIVTKNLEFDIEKLFQARGILKL